MVDALRRVRLRRSETRLWTCCAGRAGTRIRSEALHRILTIGLLPRIPRERVRERVPTRSKRRDLLPRPTSPSYSPMRIIRYLAQEGDIRFAAEQPGGRCFDIRGDIFRTFE